MLTEKYRPKRIGDYVGHSGAVESFVKWMRDWKPGKSLILHGPPGVGKTSLVHAFASENGLDLIETNASDLRSSQELKDKIASSVSQKSLRDRGKIFLFDEIDGISGYEDKGGVTELVKIINETKYPVVLVANDPYNRKLLAVRGKSDMIQFRRLTVWDVTKRLQYIADSEKAPVSREHIRAIAKRSEGDLRSAINDLETIHKTKPSAEEMQQTGLREREVSVFSALSEIFKTDSARKARDAVGSVKESPDDIFWWIENNVINEYEKPEEVAAAYEMLSRADTLRGRIHSRQNWKLYAYMIDLMTGGVAVSKRSPYKKFTRYQYPQNIMILGRSKLSRVAAKQIFARMTRELHCSSRKIKWEFLPYMKMITEDEGAKKNFLDSLGIEKDVLKIFN